MLNHFRTNEKKNELKEKEKKGCLNQNNLMHCIAPHIYYTFCAFTIDRSHPIRILACNKSFHEIDAIISPKKFE